MRKFIYILFGLVFSHITFAEEVDGGILGNGEKLKSGDIGFGDIPNMILHAISFFMKIAGTISVVFIIVGAYQMLFGSISQDKTKGKNTIIAAIIGFVLAALSWVIIKVIIDNFN